MNLGERITRVETILLNNEKRFRELKRLIWFAIAIALGNGGLSYLR